MTTSKPPAPGDQRRELHHKTEKAIERAFDAHLVDGKEINAVLYDCTNEIMAKVDTYIAAQVREWQHVAEYWLGEYVETHTPEECRQEAIRRSIEEQRLSAKEKL